MSINSKIFAARKQKALDEVCEYILDSEEQDFKENPSDNHIYYHALVAFYDGDTHNAETELKEAINAQTNRTL